MATALLAADAAPQTAIALQAVEGYGTLEAAGIVATVSGDSDSDASATLAYRRAGEVGFRPAHPLVRIDASHFVGSLFWLKPGAVYQVQVTVADPDGVAGAATAETALSTRPELPPFVPLRTLFVAPGGDDANPGTSPAAPLATIQRAADLSTPGDLVSIAPGLYRESVDVSTSGTGSNPIVFRGSAAGAVLDGADAAIAAGVTWTHEGSGVWARATGFPTGHVVSDQGRLFRYGSLAQLQNLEAGPPGGFWFDGSTLRVRFSDGSPPGARTLHVARREDGFYLDGVSNVRVENLEIRHFGSGDFGKGVYLRYASDSAVRACRIHDIGSAGVWIKGGDRNLIEGNELWDSSITGWIWDWTKGSSAENNGVSMTDDLGRGNVVRRNRFQGTFNGIGACGDSPPPSGPTSETDVYENVFLDHNDDAIEPEGWCANVRLWGNRIEDVHMAIAPSPAAPGPTWILRNVAWNFGSTRSSQVDGWLASALKINSGYSTPVGPLLVYHNTFVTNAPATHGLALLNPGFSTWIIFRNNVISGTERAIRKANPVLTSFDHDDVHRSTPGELVHWEGTGYANLATFQAGTGQEPHGLSAPPLLVDPSNGDFTPAPGSPLIDAGLAIPGINGGASGSAPDIGAVERGEGFRVFPARFRSLQTEVAPDTRRVDRR